MTDLTTAQAWWSETLKQLQNQMTISTYDFCLRSSQAVAVRENGGLQIGVTNPAAVEWLSHRLQATVERTLAGVAGRQIGLEFLPLTGAPPVIETLPTAPVDAGPSEAGRLLAGINYYSAYFEAGGSGFSQIPHAYAYFWGALLGPAFNAWLLLLADDKSKLTKNPATWWSQPRDYSFEKLTQRLNRRHPRYVAGGEIECTRSRDRRRAGDPLRHPEDCCGGPGYDHLRFKQHSKAGLICAHWSAGQLEILDRWQLVAIEINDGYKCRLQVWRLLPYLTPHQVGLLHPTIGEEYEGWLREYGARLDPPLGYPTWQAASEKNIVPLLPTHDQPEVTPNFAERRQYQEFLRHAIPNPGYRGGDEEADDE